jgi:hypothetical protein
MIIVGPSIPRYCYSVGPDCVGSLVPAPCLADPLRFRFKKKERKQGKRFAIFIQHFCLVT